MSPLQARNFVSPDTLIFQSRGPLVNLCGEVVGINTLAGRKGQNLNFVVPIDSVQDLVPQLVAQSHDRQRSAPSRSTRRMMQVTGRHFKLSEPGKPSH